MTQGPDFRETYPAHEEESPETELDLVRGIGGAAAGPETLAGYDEAAVADPAAEDPADADDSETSPEPDGEESGAPALLRRSAAERAARTLKCYVKPPGTHDRGHNGRSHVRKLKHKKSRNRDDDRHRGGGGGAWWREKVKEAKATHVDTCQCMFCMSPVL